MKQNKWKELWNKRNVNFEQCLGDERALLLELKRSNGFDVAGQLGYDVLIKQYEQIKKMLFSGVSFPENLFRRGLSVYEVGCGSGANLYLFEKDGIVCGGLDYSSNLIEGARRVLCSEDIICAEADKMSEDIQYDAVLSNSVFSYFTNEYYALSVLEKMYKKSRYSIGLVDVHDKSKERDFLEYRKKEILNYEERYKDLPKLFYSKDFFRTFANEHKLEIVFTESNVEGYWNNRFVFNCFMYK